MSVFATRRIICAGLLSAGCLLALAGCNETVSEFSPQASPLARAPGVPVSLVSLEGAPEATVSKLSTAFAQQAIRREMLIVGVDGKPRYQVRGYVALQQSDGKTVMAWTFDLFDAQRKRAHRASGAEPVSAKSEDWSLIRDIEVDQVAAKALDEVAAFLLAGTTPVASRASAGSTPAGSIPVGRSVSMLTGGL